MPEQGLLYRGSVKDIYGVDGQDPYTFVFSDRYSIFDWGEMPDSLPQKGEALAVMGDLFFRFLADKKNWQHWKPQSFLESSPLLQNIRIHGIRHHSFGLVDEKNQILALGEKSNRLSVRSLPRIAPKSSVSEGKITWDYSAYQTPLTPMLVPLEVVFRFGAPKGSSYLKRANVEPNTWLEKPVVEFFTKLEPTDRFLSAKEAKKIAGLSELEFQDLQDFTLLVASRLKDLFAELGLELWDGKFEFAFSPGEKDRRSFMLVDSIGPDELRLLAGKVHFSKEILRVYYRDSSWAKAVEEAKKLAEARGIKDWKKICREELRETPKKLDAQAFKKVCDLYPALAEAIAKKLFDVSYFPEAPSLTLAIDALKDLR